MKQVPIFNHRYCGIVSVSVVTQLAKGYALYIERMFIFIHLLYKFTRLDSVIIVARSRREIEYTGNRQILSEPRNPVTPAGHQY